MASLYLSDIMRRNNLDPNKVKLIRHSLKDKEFKLCYERNFMEEYQRIQSEKVFNGCDYILSFVSEPGTSAKFIGCYEVIKVNNSAKKVKATKKVMPKDFPIPSMFNDVYYYFYLDKSDLLCDLEGRLIIDWGKSVRSWCQWAKNEKEVLSIQQNSKFFFNGFENIVLSFDELKEIIDDPILYENWHTALSSIYAIYLIVDMSSGELYIGSAYGSGGLLERWKCYIKTKDGGNKKMANLIKQYPNRYHDFQFSILQILPKTVTNNDVIAIESLYKKKLLSIKYGLNDN